MYRLTDTIKVYERRDWNARPPRPGMAVQPLPSEAFLHHSAGAAGHDTLAEQKAAMRGIQSQHMDGNGWSDVGYHFVIFEPHGHLRHARIFQARDPRAVPAAQSGHNTGTLAVCVVGNFENATLKRNTRYAIGVLLSTGTQSFALETVGGHRDVVATACPGDGLYKFIARIAKAANLRVYK